MSDVHDVHDDTFDDLEAQLVRALHREADAHDPTTPPTTTIRTVARRRDRRRQLEIGSAVLITAALIVVLIVGPWRGNEDAYVDSGPSDVKPPLHLDLDPAAGFELMQASTYRLDASGQTPGTAPGPEGRSSHESILVGGADPLTPPWLLIDIRTMTNPTGPWGDPGPGEQATAVASRPAVLRSYGLAAGADRDWTMIALKWDALHEVSVRFWGMDLDAATAALASLNQDESGRWTIGEPPAGLREVARDVEDVGADWYQDATGYRDNGTASRAFSPTMSITRTAEERSEPELAARALGSSWEQTTTIERTTVRGHPAIVVAPGTADQVSLGPVPRYRVLWYEPDHDVVVDLIVYDADRSQVDRTIANLREVGEAEWRTTLATCTGVEYGGTISSLPSSGTGGPCPGFEMVGG